MREGRGSGRPDPEQARTVDRVEIGGGDGTLNAAAPGLLDAQLPLGVVPLGTANDLARTLGLPLQVEAAAQLMAAGRQRAGLTWAR
jgi:diacylglycerol kinase (ATP)